MITKKHGIFLVKLARESIENFVRNGKIVEPGEYPEILRERMGVFVTLEKYPSGELRGCIGLPYPEKPLIHGVIEAAISAARDPRFPPLRKEELDEVTVEVSVLTRPEKIEFKNPEKLLKKIVPKKDGLILKKGWNSGLFLPQVWEKIPDKIKFLEELSYKAGLWDPDAWKRSTIYRFRVKAFKEKEPYGEIDEV
ncbi:MAG: AmmeMemoRadiSam system protein A [Candidatus Aenigmarchaeota archaeon]|nr:AmmeMemoRadiSam system protein A [Candidatus Aenigmarchaeota archaeon]